MTASWPAITEQLLRERQAMSNEEFFEFFAGLLDQVGSRTLDDEHYARAIGYPWERHTGTCLVSDGEVQDLAGLHDLIEEELRQFDDRVPLLAYGANVSPERLALKFAHLPEGHRNALILAGWIDGFDVGANAQPPLFSSMPGTLVVSEGTRTRVAVLYLDLVQFTTLWWTEVTYKVGALQNVRVTLDEVDEPLERVIAFVSRWGAFCVEGEPVVMAAIEAEGRRYTPLTQEQIMDAAARLTLGSQASARDLVKGAYEEPARFFATHFKDMRSAARPFESAHWEEMPLDRR